VVASWALTPRLMLDNRTTKLITNLFMFSPKTHLKFYL
jgi:hypothetical protein